MVGSAAAKLRNHKRLLRNTKGGGAQELLIGMSHSSSFVLFDLAERFMQ